MIYMYPICLHATFHMNHENMKFMDFNLFYNKKSLSQHPAEITKHFYLLKSLFKCTGYQLVKLQTGIKCNPQTKNQIPWYGIPTCRMKDYVKISCGSVTKVADKMEMNILSLIITAWKYALCWLIGSLNVVQTVWDPSLRFLFQILRLLRKM